MHRRKRDLWKATAVVGGMLLLAFMALLTVSAADAHGDVSWVSAAGTVTVQATPNVDVTATMTALNEEKLRQEIQQLKNQNGPTFFDWLKGNVSILLLGLGAFVGLLRWLADRQDAQDKELRAQAEERFKTAVAALGDEKESIQVGGAILLRSFLNPDDKEIYGRYYTQIFDLAVAYLRLPRATHSSEDTSQPLTPLSQALIVAFEEALPLVRNTIVGGRKDREDAGALHPLDATNIQLDNAFLWRSDLKQVWMPQALLRDADLSGAVLIRANLLNANLSGAHLGHADLSGAYLGGAILARAYLYGADLSGAFLSDTDLSDADLGEVRNLETVLSLKGADLRRVKGLDDKQKAACKAMGAIIDEVPTTSPPQPTAAPSPPPQQSS